MAMIACPSCRSLVQQGGFCEQCGTRLPLPAVLTRPTPVLCLSCGGRVPKGKFCAQCGTELESSGRQTITALVTCSHCLREVPVGRFCGACGNALGRKSSPISLMGSDEGDLGAAARVNPTTISLWGTGSDGSARLRDDTQAPEHHARDAADSVRPPTDFLTRTGLSATRSRNVGPETEMDSPLVGSSPGALDGQLVTEHTCATPDADAHLTPESEAARERHAADSVSKTVRQHPADGDALPSRDLGSALGDSPHTVVDVERLPQRGHRTPAFGGLAVPASQGAEPASDQLAPSGDFDVTSDDVARDDSMSSASPDGPALPINGKNGGSSDRGFLAVCLLVIVGIFVAFLFAVGQGRINAGGTSSAVNSNGASSGGNTGTSSSASDKGGGSGGNSGIPGSANIAVGTWDAKDINGVPNRMVFKTDGSCRFSNFVLPEGKPCFYTVSGGTAIVEAGNTVTFRISGDTMSGSGLVWTRTSRGAG